MPLAMNFDLLTNSKQHDRCEHLHDYGTNLDKTIPKSPLSNGTNRQTTSLLSSPPPPPPVKPRLRSTSNRVIRKIDLQQLNRCSQTCHFALPHVENEKWLAIASSNEYMLVGGGSSSTLRLFDFQGKEIRQINIKTFAAFDIAWSNSLKVFLIAGYDSLQMYNVEKDQLTSVEDINFSNKKDNYFWSIACHNNDLFVVLSDGLESIWRLSLPTFERKQTLSGSEIRESDVDDRISCIRTNGHLIGMTFRQRTTYQWRVDLFDYVTMTRTHRGLTIGCGNGSFNFIERCMLTPVDDHQWLIIGGLEVKPNALTLMDDRTGEIKQVLRSTNRQEEFISNICTSENSKRQLIISMMIIDNKTDQRQIHIFHQ
ncbi:hypothetical protein I4U23_009206 [Adineta vaga]|nr:hypothetical protein I4U23_009206 [Adineta vaga]